MQLLLCFGLTLVLTNVSSAVYSCVVFDWQPSVTGTDINCTIYVKPCLVLIMGDLRKYEELGFLY